MKKGQGSLEYLLILAAILAIAVVVVVVANSMLSAPEGQADLQSDKYACGLQGIELVNYNDVFADTVFTPTSVPFFINYGGQTSIGYVSGDNGELLASCSLGKDTDSGDVPYILKVGRSGNTYAFNMTGTA